MKQAKQVLVLYGGTSNERDVSLRSGTNVAKHLATAGYEAELADTGAKGFNLEAACMNANVVLPILHGAGGEDGVLQHQLESIGVPYFGSSAAACELTFDKGRYKEFVAQHGVRLAYGETVTYELFVDSMVRKSPYVLKPLDGGSSVDTVIVPDLHDEPDESVFQELFSRYPRMLAETYIDGQELTVGVLDHTALPIILIQPPNDEVFDYQNKYNGRTQEIVNPEQVNAALQLQAQELALRLHHLTGCRHVSRTDMIASQDGTLYVLETNTIPGLTEQSLLPKMAAAADIGMTALVVRFVELALRDGGRSTNQ